MHIILILQYRLRVLADLPHCIGILIGIRVWMVVVMMVEVGVDVGAGAGACIKNSTG